MPYSFQDYSTQCKSRYDLIICNPPFFSGSSKTPSQEKNLARHDDHLNLEDIFRGSVSLMKKTAFISLILPVQKEAHTMDLGIEYKLYCKRLTRVIPAPGKPIRRVLMEFSTTPGKRIEDELTIETETRHVYSDTFKSLVEEFYLAL
jgi:tRNA1Val (adenine37-N6)-methyltransferase